jgi:tetratricopeptide (TPR) repeat protein
MKLFLNFGRYRSRAGLGFAVLLAAAVFFPGCASLTPRPQIPYTGDPVVDGNAQLAAAAPKDRVLWEYRIAAAALRRGQFDEARAKLDDAILQIGGILANDRDASRARHLFTGEDAKKFIGEPYERVMAYYYRGILYWRDGEPDNARACFRTGQLIDSDAENKAYASDYVLLDYLDGLASVKLAADGSDAFARAVKNSSRQPLPPYDPKANVLVFAEWGPGPTKYSGGEYGEELKFFTRPPKIHHAALDVEGRTVLLPAYDDLNFQATTRGGRVMDHILGNKAVFKSGADTVGNIALVGAGVAASNIYQGNGQHSQASENAAIALAAVGLLSKLASAATVARADIRTWDNLPQALGFAALRLPPGEYRGTLRFFDAEDRALDRLAQAVAFQVKADGDTVVFLSELKQ